MVSHILNADGATVRNIEPRILKQTISTAVSDTIVRYCNAVVETGTGSAARPAGYTMGGKTGTAEVVPRDGINYVVSFIGYVPANDPQVAIYVVIDRANQYKQDNSRLASGIVREILTEVLPYLGIPMTEELTDAERAELDNLEMNSITIPTPSADHNNDDGQTGGDGTGDGGQTGTAGGDGLSGETGDGGTGHTVRYDPETGYAIDPLTGEFLDPETGEPVEPGSPLISPHQ